FSYKSLESPDPQRGENAVTEAVATRMLGVVSNSGGRAETVSAAVGVFRAGGAEYILHLGDIGGRHVLEALGSAGSVARAASAGGAIPSGFVWGDRDGDRMGLMRYGNSVGVECLGVIGDFEYAG